MGAMVKRDRTHASVVIWSFCNEFGCEGAHEAGGPAFRDVAYHLDGSRPTLANMFTFGDLLSNTIDVQARSRTPYYLLTAPYSLLLLTASYSLIVALHLKEYSPHLTTDLVLRMGVQG